MVTGSHTTTHSLKYNNMINLTSIIISMYSLIMVIITTIASVTNYKLHLEDSYLLHDNSMA